MPSIQGLFSHNVNNIRYKTPALATRVDIPHPVLLAISYPISVILSRAEPESESRAGLS